MTNPDLDARARSVIDTNKYMTLATADESGRPWATPVFFSPDGYADLYWVSSPDAKHSRNIAARPEVSIVVFDSSVPIGGAQAVYMSARAGEVPTADLESGLGAYNARHRSGSIAGLSEFGLGDVQPPENIRLYRATVTDHSLLIRGRDPEYGTGVDSRLPVELSS